MVNPRSPQQRERPQGRRGTAQRRRGTATRVPRLDPLIFRDLLSRTTRGTLVIPGTGASTAMGDESTLAPVHIHRGREHLSFSRAAPPGGNNPPWYRCTSLNRPKTSCGAPIQRDSCLISMSRGAHHSAGLSCLLKVLRCSPLCKPVFANTFIFS